MVWIKNDGNSRALKDLLGAREDLNLETKKKIYPVPMLKYEQEIIVFNELKERSKGGIDLVSNPQHMKNYSKSCSLE